MKPGRGVPAGRIDAGVGGSQAAVEGGTGTGPTRRQAISGSAALVAGGLAAGAVLAGAPDAFAESAAKAKSKTKGSSGTELNVNGEDVVVTYAPDTMLLFVLRDELHLRGPTVSSVVGCRSAARAPCWPMVSRFARVSRR
jgi:hypothetical protein